MSKKNRALTREEEALRADFCRFNNLDFITLSPLAPDGSDSEEVVYLSSSTGTVFIKKQLTNSTTQPEE